MDTFWSDVTSGLVSGVTVAFILWLVAKITTNFFDKPNLSIVVKQEAGYSDKIQVTPVGNGTYKANFQLAVRNRGSAPFRGGSGYWHLYNFVPQNPRTSKFLVPGELNHQRDLIRDPVYANSFTDITDAIYNIVISEDELQHQGLGLRYFIQTEYENFPASIKLDQHTGHINLLHAGKIPYFLAPQANDFNIEEGK